MTGIEAISNGITAFKEPASRNAAATMIWMATILASIFLGLTFLAVHSNILPAATIGFSLETTMSQMGRTIFGKGGLYLWLQISTALILVLAANTSFAGFPRLAALIARDNFLPKQLSSMGDRLVFDRGILSRAILSAALIWWRRADVHLLIPVYAVGVFLSFTISQSGMVLRWRRLRSTGWQFKALVNGIGAIATLLVLGVISFVKFLSGAWLEHCRNVPLVILEAPYRTVVEPLTSYLGEVQRETPTTRVTVVVAEFVAPRWWQNLLHGHTGFVLKPAMLNRKNVVLTNVRYHLQDEKVALLDMLDMKHDYLGRK